MCDNRHHKILLSFWADHGDLRAIDLEARHQGISRSALLRHLMRVYVECRGDANRKADVIMNKLLARMENSF